MSGCWFKVRTLIINKGMTIKDYMYATLFRIGFLEHVMDASVQLEAMFLLQSLTDLLTRSALAQKVTRVSNPDVTNA